MRVPVQNPDPRATSTTPDVATRATRALRARRTIHALALACAAAMSACSLWPRLPESFRDSETALEAAREAATLGCLGAAQCDALWAHAAAFVRAHASTRIVRADDEAVETARPGEFGVAYFWVERMRADEGGTVVRLKGMCRGMYTPNGGPGWTYASCAKQIVERENQFRSSMLPSQ